MTTKIRTVRLTDSQIAALESLARKLNISGQRNATFAPLLSWLADTADGALNETAAALEIAAGCAAGGEWDLLVEVIRPERETE